MRMIMDIIGPEHLELFALILGKIAELDFVYTLASIYIISQISLIMDLIGLELPELSVFELEELPYLTLFTIQHLQILINQHQTW